MKNILKFEQLGIFALSIFLFQDLAYSWWVYLLWFLAPDISMLGYLVNANIGAKAYNLFHHQGVAILLYIMGATLTESPLTFAGLILLGHSSFDRLWGYGLKYTDSFHHTHLGMLKQPKEAS